MTLKALAKPSCCSVSTDVPLNCEESVALAVARILEDKTLKVGGEVQAAGRWSEGHESWTLTSKSPSKGMLEFKSRRRGGLGGPGGPFPKGLGCPLPCAALAKMLAMLELTALNEAERGSGFPILMMSKYAASNLS